MSGSLIRPFQPIVVRGFSKYTRISTSMVLSTRWARPCSRVAYSRAATWSWIEHGPTTTNSRGSCRSRMRRTALRLRKTNSSAADGSGMSRLTCSGVGSSSLEATLMFCRRSVIGVARGGGWQGATCYAGNTQNGT